MRILLPTDGSRAANEAVEFVRAIAQDNPVDVVVLMVSCAPVPPDSPDSVPDWAEQERVHIEKVLERTNQTLHADCQSVTTCDAAGSVVSCILEHAKSSRADVIVMGAKGYSTTLPSLLGSVSDNIATRAECSVCVVRPKRNGKHHLDKLLLAIDSSEASNAAITELMQIKLDRETQVSVVSVAQNPRIYIDDGYVASPTPLAPEQIALIRDAAERMAGRVADQYPRTDFQTPAADHVGEAIVQAAAEADTGMIIVGDAGSHRQGDFFLGSTSKYVLRHAPCSVWISRHHWKSGSSKQANTDAAAVR